MIFPSNLPMLLVTTKILETYIGTLLVPIREELLCMTWNTTSWIKKFHKLSTVCHNRQAHRFTIKFFSALIGTELNRSVCNQWGHYGFS